MAFQPTGQQTNHATPARVPWEDFLKDLMLATLPEIDLVMSQESDF